MSLSGSRRIWAREMASQGSSEFVEDELASFDAEQRFGNAVASKPLMDPLQLIS